MFTIKFYSYFEGDVNVETVLCSPHYDIYTHPSGKKTVTVYKDFCGVDGVSYIVLSDELAKVIGSGGDYYHVGYIENLAGKTIAKISSK